MAKEITMPKLSDTMTEGLFAGWRKNVGDRIERGDIIAEVETDKAVMELEAFASGVLLKTMAVEGELIPVGTVLGLIGKPEELVDAASTAPVSAPDAADGPAASAPVAQAVPKATEPHREQDHEKASPLVRRMARDLGIDLGQVHGSGPEGRITREDMEDLAARKGLQPGETPVRRELPTAGEPTHPLPASPMRQAISAAVTQSWQTIPHFSVTVEINMEACREVVDELKDSGNGIGYNALLIKACAVALKDFPLLRSAAPDKVNGLHISFAVALADGLLMPVIRECDTLSAAAIGREAERLAEKCRSGRLSSEEMSGGSFSVSNLGMYGIDDFTALIMPGQAAILASGAVVERPIVRNGAVVPAATMRVTLSSDHRIVDGAYAARFLAELRSILEKPVSLLV